MSRLLGLNLEHAVSDTLSTENIPEEVRALITERENARVAKDWQKADALREKITEAGFDIEDTDTGFYIKRAAPRLSP